MNKKEYSIGLDIGTSSVGWAVTDLENNLLKKGKKNMWGSRTFKEADTAATRRSFRSARRMIRRKKERISIFRDLIKDDIDLVDVNFFKKLSETFFKIEDREFNNLKYNLFKETGMTDKDYYKKYPTIYHLRNELITNNEKKDIRLVYLAIHHILKNRGNFLYEGEEFSNNISDIDDILEAYIDFLENQNISFLISKQILKENMVEIFKQKGISNTEKMNL